MRRATLKDERVALRRRACGRGGLAAHARLRWRLAGTSAAAAAACVAMPSVLAPVDLPSSEKFTVSDVAVEYETDLRGDDDDEADGQFDADDAGAAAAGS